ncbi:Ldh family oxidoreductase [Roseomonas hellenica]|uniref:Ldh family oxidoreductase n=1 Tax=Plastoroseomonas hellenica TaxID=2687306 RepID=A0ABS5EU27_9PROT|nr:Ldh family oxidoreductase [Plastoroseomonas hellenica]MBR0663798.1 Ldh family oxidoreductase [Plastoroseomonas hellenica]
MAPPDVVRLAAPALQALARDIFVAVGVGADDAALWAETLVWANLRGVDSHGVLRIPRYLELIAQGGIHPRPAMRLLKAAGAIALLDADRAPGPVAMARAMEEAIAAARRVHVGWCVARDITHAGAVGHFALRAAAAGMAGLVMTASIPLMAWPGSRRAVVSTNPIAIAIPAGRHPPLLLDMATAKVALGKIMSARQTGAPIPPDWGIDAEGAPTTDATAVATLLPMAGPKGAGLSLMIECLASLAAGNPVIAPALAGAPGTAKGGTAMNGVAIALDLAAFGDPAGFVQSVDALAEAVAAQPKAAGTDALLLPGERGDAELARRRRSGIPLPAGVWKQLTAAATRLGVSLPAPLEG